MVGMGSQVGARLAQDVSDLDARLLSEEGANSGFRHWHTRGVAVMEWQMRRVWLALPLIVCHLA